MGLWIFATLRESALLNTSMSLFLNSPLSPLPQGIFVLSVVV